MDLLAKIKCFISLPLQFYFVCHWIGRISEGMMRTLVEECVFNSSRKCSIILEL